MKWRRPCTFISLPLCLAALLGCSERDVTSPWMPAGTLVYARSGHSATPLSDGSVLFAGGERGSTTLASAERRDTATNQWSLASSMQEPRVRHAAVRVDNGRVLVMGGANLEASSSVEAFDPATNQFSAAAPMTSARDGLAAIWVASSKEIVVMGGRDASAPVGSVEAYDPQIDVWSPLPSMYTAREGHTATLLAGQTILVVGGTDGIEEQASAERYDAQTKAWSDAGSMMDARCDHTATLLEGGSVLVVGGANDDHALASAELYDAARNAWSSTVGPLHHARRGHTATLLNDGNVLIVGGEDDGGPLDSVEIYDVASGAFVEAEALVSARIGHTATWLSDGSILVVGGLAGEDLATAERFVPADTRIPCQRTEDCPQAMACGADLRCVQSEGPLTSDGACSYAGGGALPGGAASAFIALAAMLLSRRRRNDRIARRGAAAAFAIATALAPAWSDAQTPTFSLDRLPTGGGSQDGAGVWRPVFGPTGLFGQVAFGVALNPLRVVSFVHDPEKASALSGPAVSTQITGYATVGVELAERGAVLVTMPYVVYQRGNPTDNRTVGLNQVVAMAPSAPGDLRIDGRMLVAATAERSFALALSGAMLLPTGDESSFTGEGHAWGSVGLSAEYDARAFFVTVNAGFALRPKSSLVDLTVGSELVYALGTYVPVMKERLRLGAELFGAVGLLSRDQEALPLEGMLSGRLALGEKRRVFLGLSAGGRLTPGYAPDMRLVARIGGAIPFQEAAPEPTLPVRLVEEPDTDGDGFLDLDDKCPLAREDNKRAKDGCPETDEDNDGIDSSLDACPAVPEDKDGINDTDGCPEEDADGDGFADTEDKCPKEPGVRNEDPAKLGCPKFIERTKTEVKLNKQIDFDFNKATITPESYPILDEIAKLLATNADIKQLRIEGHTDNVGDAASNQALSVRRAEAVRDHLVQRGKVDASRVSFEGFGQTRPIAPKDTPGGRAKNRRVVLRIGE